MTEQDLNGVLAYAMKKVEKAKMQHNEESRAVFDDSFKFKTQTCDVDGDIHDNKNTVTDCKECGNLGVTLVPGDTYADPVVCKSCSQDGGYTARGYDFNFELQRFFSQKVRIPNSHLIDEIDKDNNYTALEQWYNTLPKMKDKSLLITGMTGLGKTLLSNIFMLQYLKDKKDRINSLTCLSTTTSEILEAYEFYNSSRTTHFSMPQENSDKYSNKKKWEILKKNCKDAEFLIIDELGFNKKEQIPLFDIIDLRESSNKITIYISNHDFEREKSLNKKSLLSILGDRIESRLRKASYIMFTGNDRRSPNVIDTLKEDFMLPEVIQYSTDEYVTHMCNWMVSNPIFEQVHSHRRNKLTKEITDNDGNVIKYDLPREDVKTVKGLWYKNDVLKIGGPLCDLEDALFYQVLLNMLAFQHKSGCPGIRLYAGISDIFKACKFKSSGAKNYQNVERRLLRLKNIEITYHKSGRLRWSDGLIDRFNMEENWIDFNPSMVPFYSGKGDFTIYDKKRIEMFSGFSALIFFFLESHSDPSIPAHKDIEFWKKLASVKRKTTKEENRVIREAFKSLEGTVLVEGSVKVKKKVSYKVLPAYLAEKKKAFEERKKKGKEQK